MVNVTNVIVLDNPTAFTNDFQFEITFECLQELSSDLEWKVIYVGSAEAEEFDQVLEEVEVGPVPVGINRFVLTAVAPNVQRIPNITDLVGVTVILITCSYKEREFVRIGYYVNNDYDTPLDPDNLPTDIDVSRLRRMILSEEPRVTRLPIDWSGSGGDGLMDSAEAEAEAAEYDQMNEDMEQEGGEGMDEEDSVDEDDGDGDGEIDLADEDDEMIVENDDSMDVEQMQQQQPV